MYTSLNYIASLPRRADGLEEVNAALKKALDCNCHTKSSDRPVVSKPGKVLTYVPHFLQHTRSGTHC